MLFRISIFFTLMCFSTIIIGCSALLLKQELSENYSLLDGTMATSPQMIDGNINTIGETTFPSGATATFGSNPASEVIITLPEKKLIRKVIVHTDNLKTFDIFADQGGVINDTDWKLIKEVKSVKASPIEIPVMFSFPTNRIRLRVLSTTDDASLKRTQRARSGGMRVIGQNRRAVGKIREIELFGYITAEKTEIDTTAETREKELDDLLDTE